MKRLGIALILLLPFFAMSQEQNSLTVTGTALKSVAPNEMHIMAGVTAEGGDAQKMYTLVRDKMAKAMAYLKAEKGVKSYETDVVQLHRLLPAQVPNSPYNCMQTLNIVLTDFSLYDQLMLDLFEIGFNEIGNVQFAVSSLEEIKKQVALEAVSVAKAKANAYADALGVTLGPVISFSEQNFYSGPSAMVNYKETGTYAPAGPSIAPNQVEVMMSVIVSFAIKTEE